MLAPPLCARAEYNNENNAAYTAAVPLLEYAAGAVSMICADTGEVLYGFRPHELHYPASIVKTMTALLVLENVADLNEIVTMSATAATLPDYAARLGLVAGDRFTVLEGLYGIMLPSANEVANALAEHVAGTREAFVQMMNDRAYALGAYHTHFVNACGLPGDGQHTTAYDLSRITRAALAHPVFVEIINTEYFDFPPHFNRPEGRTIRNTNRLVRSGDELFSPYNIGGKTGWIIAARNTLSTYARRGEYGLVITVLYVDERADTFLDTLTLMEYGFAMLETLRAPEPTPTPEPIREIVESDPDEVAAAFAQHEYERRRAEEETARKAQEAAATSDEHTGAAESNNNPSSDVPNDAAEPDNDDRSTPPWEAVTTFGSRVLMGLGVVGAAVLLVILIRANAPYK